MPGISVFMLMGRGPFFDWSWEGAVTIIKCASVQVCECAIMSGALAHLPLAHLHTLVFRQTPSTPGLVFCLTVKPKAQQRHGNAKERHNA